MSCDESPFPIRSGDELPVLVSVATYKTPDGKKKKFNFTGWTALTFTMVKGLTTVTGVATGSADGILSYQWQPGDTATPGKYQGKFTGLSPEGRPQTFPTKGFITIDVLT